MNNVDHKQPLQQRASCFLELPDFLLSNLQDLTRRSLQRLFTTIQGLIIRNKKPDYLIIIKATRLSAFDKPEAFRTCPCRIGFFLKTHCCARIVPERD